MNKMNTTTPNSLECGICLLQYTQQLVPVSLPQCGHTFCKSCINQILSGKGISSTCPFCKKDFIVLPDGTYLLPQNNYAVLDILEESRLTNAYQDRKESLPKVHSALDKTENEILQAIDRYFNDMESLITQQRQEWKNKVAQVYSAEKERLSVQNTANQHEIKALEQKIRDYKMTAHVNLSKIQNVDFDTLFKKIRHQQLEDNVKAYVQDLNKLAGEALQYLKSYSVSPITMEFTEKLIPSLDIYVPYLTAVRSCLSFRAYRNQLNIDIRRTQDTIDITKILDLKDIHRISLNVDDSSISDEDFELLKMIFDNFPQLEALSVEFGAEVKEHPGDHVQYQREIFTLLKIVFQDITCLSYIRLAWNSASGAEAALDFLGSQVFTDLSDLKTLELELPKVKLDMNYFKIFLNMVFPRFKKSLEDLVIVIQGLSSGYLWPDVSGYFSKLKRLTFRILSDNAAQEEFTRNVSSLIRESEALEALNTVLCLLNDQVGKELLSLFKVMQQKNSFKSVAVYVVDKATDKVRSPVNYVKAIAEPLGKMGKLEKFCIESQSGVYEAAQSRQEIMKILNKNWC